MRIQATAIYFNIPGDGDYIWHIDVSPKRDTPDTIEQHLRKYFPQAHFQKAVYLGDDQTPAFDYGLTTKQKIQVIVNEYGRGADWGRWLILDCREKEVQYIEGGVPVKEVELALYTRGEYMTFALDDSRLPSNIMDNWASYFLCTRSNEPNRARSSMGVTSVWFEPATVEDRVLYEAVYGE